MIDRIRRDFSALPHAHPEGALYATFSAGVASCPGSHHSAAGLTEAADQALLQAKRLGRNRVETEGLIEEQSYAQAILRAYLNRESFLFQMFD